MASSSTENLLESLNALLSEIEADPTNALDKKVIDESIFYLAPNLEKPARVSLTQKLSQILVTIQTDPTSLIKLLLALVKPLSFSDVLEFEPAVDFVSGLNTAAGAFNGLFLSLLAKATDSPKDAAILATSPGTVHALVQLWLQTPDTDIARQADAVLYGLLCVDQEGSEVQKLGTGETDLKSHGQGLVWRRVFGDKGVYGVLFSICSLKSDELQLGKSRKTIAQGRLLDMVPRLGQLDWAYLTTSHHPDIEQAAGLSSNNAGLLEFAAVHMIEKSDILMYVNLVTFYEDLIKRVNEPSMTEPTHSVAVDFLIKHNIHKTTIDIWLNTAGLDPIDVVFLYGYSATYLGTYAFYYPESFLKNRDLVRAVLVHLSKQLEKSPGQWSGGASPAQDLELLTMLPKICLMPTKWLSNEATISSPYLKLPTKTISINEDALKALGLLFSTRTPRPAKNGYDETKDKAIARVLYLAYIAYNPLLFDDLLQQADTLALLDKACTAMDITMYNIIDSDWARLEDSNLYDFDEPPQDLNDLPNETQLDRLLPISDLVPTGDEALYSGLEHVLLTPIRTKFIPWLLKAPQRFNLAVQTRRDGAEDASFKAAQSKYRLLTLVKEKLENSKSHSPRLDSVKKELLPVLQERWSHGVWGESSEIGGRVATLQA